jgi:neurofibromin 1
LIAARADLEGQRLWIATALQLLELFTRKADVCVFDFRMPPPWLTCFHSQASHVQEIQLAPTRLHAFALAEIAFVVSLTSADSGVSQSASKGLRVLAETDRQPGAPLLPSGDQDDRKSRNVVYEQLGDPNVMIVGTYDFIDLHFVILT